MRMQLPIFQTFPEVNKAKITPECFSQSSFNDNNNNTKVLRTSDGFQSMSLYDYFVDCTTRNRPKIL